MLFNSISFAVFLPVVFALYWLAAKKSVKIQNLILLGASYYFYGSWDVRFLFLLIFSTLLDYFSGIKMADAKTSREKKIWFWLSVGINLGFLSIFKYYNFFVSSFAEMLAELGLQVNPWTLQVILPVGISFYTFHGLSYVIDIYQGRIKTEKNFIDYSLFVSYFPLLVAGPIERATHLLPQLKKPKTFNNQMAVDGLRQMLWGFFKKVVIADNCAQMVNYVFADYQHLPGSTLLVGGILFSFQIYGDFSGYSDIALGASRMFGIELLKNFSFPYFSRDIAEFWRRWHISLSSWFRDYLYIPLGGSKGGNWQRVKNTLIIFLVSGFWHGANWTFIAWGLLNALFIIPSVFRKTNRVNLDIVAKGRILPTFKDFLAVLITFSLTTLAWILFRAESLTQAFGFYKGMFSASLFSIPHSFPKVLFLLIGFLIIIEWIGREGNYALEKISKINGLLRWTFYYMLILSIYYFYIPAQSFIYFQF